MRVLGIALLLSTAAFAGDLENAESDFNSSDAKRIRKGCATLVRRNDRLAVDVLIRVLRKTAKEHDREEAAFDKECDKASEKMAESLAMIDGLGTRAKSKAEFDKGAAESMRTMTEGIKMMTAALERNLPHATRYDVGRAALDRFTSDEAVGRMVEVAERERPGRIRLWLLASLRTRTTPAVGALFLMLCEDRDPRTRAVAVRGLGKHFSLAGAPQALVKATADESWQVRRGAYAALFAAESAEPLAAAREKETGDEARRIAGYLHDLKKGPAPPAAPEVAFGLPLTSIRVRYVVDLSKEAEPKRQAIRDELAKALEALPEAAELQVVTIGRKVESLGNKPWTLKKGSARRVLKWFDACASGGKASDVRIRRNVVPGYDHPSRGKRVFEQLPDSVYLVLGPAEDVNDESVLFNFARWNVACDAKVYVRLYAKEPSADLTKAVATLGGVLKAGE